jgi:O-antigen ligase
VQIDFSDIKAKLLPASGAMLFVLFAVMLPRYTETAKTWYVLLILLALVYLMFNFNQLKDTKSAERLFFAAIVVNFLWIAFCYYANGEPGRGASFLWGRHFYFLFVIPLFFLFRRIEIPDRVILLALFASVTVSLTDILIDLAQGIDHRLQGTNPNGFGPIQLCMSGILLFYCIEKPEKSLRWLALGGALMGLATVIFSKSRSTWLTLAVLSILFLFYLARSLPLWKRLGLVGGLLLVLASSYLLPIVKNRVDHSLASIDNYLATDDYRDASRLSSIGIRLELWKTGWKIFQENPVLGVGVGGFQVMARANSERYQVNDVVHHYKYVHNQYLAALATRGLPGLILFLLVMLIPVYIAMSQKAQERDSAVARLSIIFICLTYLIGSLAEDHFEIKSATMFTGVMLPLLLARISNDRLQQNRKSLA